MAILFSQNSQKKKEANMELLLEQAEKSPYRDSHLIESGRQLLMAIPDCVVIQTATPTSQECDRQMAASLQSLDTVRSPYKPS